MEMPVSPLTVAHDVVGRPRVWTMEQKRLAIYVLCAVIDIAAVIGGFAIAAEVRSPRWLAVEGVPLLAGAVPVFLIFALVHEAYSVQCLNSFAESVRRTLAALGATAMVIVAFAFFAQIGAALSRLAFAYAILSAGVLLIGGRLLISLMVRWGLAGSTVKRLLIVDGTEYDVEADCAVLKAETAGLRPDLFDPVQLEKIAGVVEPYDHVFLSCPDDRRDVWITALKAAGISFELLVSHHAIHNAVAIGRYGKSDTLVLSRGPLSLSSRIKKRVFDLALTIPILILIAPLLIAVAIAIRLESPGPALFTQNRIGRGNRSFRIYKFRSMRMDDSDANGVLSTQRDDQRITRVGRFIRSSSIDELPQLFNVLLGNMSLVGPRPHAYASTAGEQLFWEVSQRYWMRHALKPGITGLAQIRGFRGSTDKPEDLESRLRCDLEYLQNWNLWQDLVIVAATARVLKHHNAF